MRGAREAGSGFGHNLLTGRLFALWAWKRSEDLLEQANPLGEVPRWLAPCEASVEVKEGADLFSERRWILLKRGPEHVQRLGGERPGCTFVFEGALGLSGEAQNGG